MSLKFLKEFEIEKETDINELSELEINFLTPNRLEIIVPHLPAAGTIGKLFYLMYNRLNYLFDYLDYQVVVRENLTIDKNGLKEYFSFVCSTPFFWKDKRDLVFFCEQKDSLENFIFRRNIVYLQFSDPTSLNNWKPKLIILKEILGKLGLTNIRFAASQQKEKEKTAVKNNNLGDSETNSKVKKSDFNLSNSPAINSGKKINKSSLLKEWAGRKLFELGVHTKFSTLDGVNSPDDYAMSAQQKNYAALAVTEHYNVQSFPEFSNHQSKDLQIIYGCEMEMLEDDLPPYIFNHSKRILEEKITELTYCVFDLETTGFFSEYNEIIEIGYVVYHQGEIIREGEYLICPEKEIPAEILATWYTNIDPEELKKAPTIKEILPTLLKEWEGRILVAHNAGKFDYGFLNKVWKEHFGEELPHPVLDTLPLSWILFPERKSYSLEKLSHVPGRGKIVQTHRALDDSKLLAELLGKLLKFLKENKISHWGEVKGLIKEGFFPNRGYKVKVLAANQEGLHNLYRLITLSHTERLFKKPSVFRSDLVKYRHGLLIGAAGGREGETFSLFSSFNFEKRKQEKLRFYDYIEVNSSATFRYLWLNGQISEAELKNMTKKIIAAAEELKIPVIASHHVYYCEKKERLLKEIIVANEGINGSRHYLYNQATLNDKEDRFSYLPPQHLLNLEEMIDNWLFLNDKHLMEKLIFKYPQAIANKVVGVSVKQPPLNYSSTKSSGSEENDLISAYTGRTKEIFGNHWPDFVKERIEKEWQIIKGRYVFIYWLAYKVVQKTHQDGSLVGSRGSIGSSFIAYLCGITDLNPLPFYKFCQKCRYVERYETQDRVYSGYDYREKANCPNCSSLLTMEGHNLPFETFFGWEGEKTPDIDLNFSGEYQKIAHNYVRQLLGAESVYRIGTINTLSQQTAEIFWKEHLKLRKSLNPDFNEERWFKEWVNSEKLKELERKSSQFRREKNQLEAELKKNTELELAENIKKKISENEEEIRAIWEELRTERERPKEEIIEELKGIKRTTGQHPGGLLITLPNTDIQKYTPLNYPADNRQSEWMTTHFEYSFLSEIFLKVDILGHDEPTILHKLFQLTGVDPNKIPFHDESIMQMFTNADTLGIPEFGTDFVKRNLLTPLKPTKFSQLVQISGFSHGTNVWTQNQHTIYKNGQLSLSELIACREDIWNFLVSWGVDNKNSFIATEFIRKGKWEKLPENIKEEMRSKLNDKEGELYFSILSKIKYIFPKPHAIAYTMTAWRTASYKLYHPQEFYSVLLTYHTAVYDIWLMTLDPAAITFRLDGLLGSLTNYKNSEKELLSIIKVFEELNKEKRRIEKTVKGKKISGSTLEKMDIDKILESIQEKINNSEDKNLIDNLRKNGRTWKLTAKEKHLLFTLKVVLEMEMKGLKFARGLDFNNSEVKDFKIENNTIYFPFTAIAGIGDKLAEKIITYRQEKGKITSNWKEELTGVLNINHIQQLENLEKYNLVINL